MNFELRSWKTTVSAIATALFGFILMHPHYFQPWMVDVAQYAVMGGLISIGYHAKDKDVHSTAGEVEVATLEKQVALGIEKENQK